jgi:RND superfamily putative drug exporter
VIVGNHGQRSRQAAGATDIRPEGSAESGNAGGSPLYRWGLVVARRKRVVLVAWALLIVAGFAFLPRFSSSLSMGGLWVPGSESSRAASLLARELPRVSGNEAVLVFSSRTLGVDDPGFRRVVANATHNVSAVRDVSGIELPYGVPARELTAPGGHTAIALVGLRGNEGQTEHLAARLASAATAATTASVHVGVTGEPQIAHDFVVLMQGDVLKVDAIGLPIAMAVLVIVFGSLIAAGLPLLLALCSLVLTFGAFGLFSFLAGGGINTILESVTAMLGLGIGIDYALFIVTRFREELVRTGEPAATAAKTTATAGRTVLVSGSTVMAALAPVLLINDPMIREVMLGPMIAIAVLIAAALSLLPATLAGLGPWVNRLAPVSGMRERVGRERPASRLTALLMRRPLVVLMSVTVALAGLSVFTLELHTGFDFGLSAVTNQPSGRADATLAADFGPGEISPIQVVFTTGGQPLSIRDLQRLAQLDTRIRRDRHIQSVTSLPDLLGGPAAAAQQLASARTDRSLAASLGAIVNTDHGSTLTVTMVVPRSAFDTAQATQVVSNLRRELPSALRGTDMRALVGGTSAGIVDLSHEINTKTPLVLALILVVAVLVLAIAFRSPLVALVGLAGTLLSVGAAYGLLVLVFQNGAGQAVFGFHSPGFLQNWLPLILFAVLVGLSTDYHVFLVSRVREEWAQTGDPARAITVGLKRSVPVILSAATIMIVVFASFIFAIELVLKEVGFAFAIVILIDAVLTRRLLVPAVLRLLGDLAWKHPGPHRLNYQTTPMRH